MVDVINKHYKTVVLISAVTIALYLITFNTNNPHIFNRFTADEYAEISKCLSSLIPAPRGLSYCSYTLEHILFGSSVIGMHVIQLLIHIVNAIFVYLISYKLLTHERLKTVIAHGSTWAVFAGLLFAIHPNQTTLVNYNLQYPEILASFSVLATIYFYIMARVADTLQKKYYILSLVFTFLAASTKEVTATLPLTLIGLEFLLIVPRTLETIKSRLLYLTPFLITPLIIIGRYFYYAVSKSPETATAIDFLDQATNAVVPGREVSRLDYYLTQPHVITHYLEMLFYPIRQKLFYDPILSTNIDPQVLISLAIITFLIIIGIVLIRKRPLVTFGIFFFFMSITMTVVTPLSDLIFDYRVYLSLFGYILVFIIALEWIHNHLSDLGQHVSLKKMLVSILIIYGLLGLYRNYTYGNEEVLLANDYQVNPINHRTLNHYWLYLATYKNDYERSLEVALQWQGIQPGICTPTKSVATSYLLLEEYESAISEYTKAIELSKTNTIDEGCEEGTRTNLAVAYIKSDDTDNALEQVTILQSEFPETAKYYEMGGDIHMLREEYTEAVDDYTQAYTLDPSTVVQDKLHDASGKLSE